MEAAQRGRIGREFRISLRFAMAYSYHTGFWPAWSASVLNTSGAMGRVSHKYHIQCPHIRVEQSCMDTQQRVRLRHLRRIYEL
jgi:hypothetical protein